MTPATNSGRPSVRSCNARTSADSAASDGTRAATYSPTSASVKSSSGELGAEAMQTQLVAHRRERVVRRDQLRHAEAAEPQQARAGERRRAR